MLESLFRPIKKRLQLRCFPVKFAKFLRTPISKDIYERLLLHLFRDVVEWTGWNIHDGVFLLDFHDFRKFPFQNCPTLLKYNQAQMFSWQFFNFLQNSHFAENLLVAASETILVSHWLLFQGIISNAIYFNENKQQIR